MQALFERSYLSSQPHHLGLGQTFPEPEDVTGRGGLRHALEPCGDVHSARADERRFAGARAPMGRKLPGEPRGVVTLELLREVTPALRERLQSFIGERYPAVLLKNP